MSGEVVAAGLTTEEVFGLQVLLRVYGATYRDERRVHVDLLKVPEPLPLPERAVEAAAKRPLPERAAAAKRRRR